MLGWLFAGDLAREEESTQNLDWTTGLRQLKAIARDFEPRKDKEQEKEKSRASTVPPIGLRNRWRIWEVLEHIGADGEQR